MILFSIFSAPISRSEPDVESTSKVNGLLKDQFQKEQIKLKTLESDDQKRLVELDALKVKVIKDSVALSQRESAGFAQFMSFIHLLKVRYTDRTDKKSSDFQEAAEISVDDVKNINQLFTVYLNRTPLSGRVSAGIAGELLESGREELEKLIAIHAKPNVDNNSDLAIIAKNVEDAQSDLKILAELAVKLANGIRIDSYLSQALSGIPATQRNPAGTPIIPNPKAK